MFNPIGFSIVLVIFSWLTLNILIIIYGGWNAWVGWLLRGIGWYFASSLMLDIGMLLAHRLLPGGLGITIASGLDGVFVILTARRWFLGFQDVWRYSSLSWSIRRAASLVRK
jgi:hypothetical protein